jgi:hypothetical protein
LRQALCGAKNIVAAIRGKRKTPFAFTTLGQLATIGRRTGVASILGVHVSGLFAWWLWRTIYLAKLPRFEKKLRVALHWTLDLFFPKDFVQHVTLHGIERVNRRLTFFREHPPLNPVPGKSDALPDSIPAENSPAVLPTNG